MYKKILISLNLFFLSILLTSCTSENSVEYERFQTSFIGLFDTHSVILGYSHTQQEFDKNSAIIYDELQRLHNLFDIFNEYEGINNLKTINNNAGIVPVEVDDDIIDLLKFSKEMYTLTDGLVNIALGPVLSIWDEYRDFSLANPDLARLPSMEKLELANNYTNINDIIIDEDNNTVFLKHENMSLNVGAIAKGYAVELAALKAIEIGFYSSVISVGGNVRTAYPPGSYDRDTWSIGIQDPNLQVGGVQNIIDIVFINHMSVVSSGGYERYYMVDGNSYNHIINPKTLMPSNKHNAVTIIYPDSGVADTLSTFVFILPLYDGLYFIESFEGAEALWVSHDETVTISSGYHLISRDYTD
jgi:FAD:protein FMN transferase